MSVINFRSEELEIAEYLTSIGCPDADHHFILDRLRIEPEAHLRYLNNAREAARSKMKH